MATMDAGQPNLWVDQSNVLQDTCFPPLSSKASSADPKNSSLNLPIAPTVFPTFLHTESQMVNNRYANVLKVQN